MKILGILLVVLLVIIALLGIGLQMFLTKGLTAALNQGVFPAVKSMYGLDLSITNASINLLRGTAQLDGFAVRNLKGYEQPRLLTFDRCVLDVEMLSLLKRDPVVIKLAEVDGAVLVIERNRERQFNVKELADALRPVESAEQPAPAPAEKAPSSAPEQPAPAPQKPAAAQPPLLPVHIRRVAVDMTVKYADTRRAKEYDLGLRLTGSDLFTVPAEAQPDSLLVLRGAMTHDQDSFVTDLNAILSPLTDPQRPTFRATGSILDIDAEFLADLLKKNNMSSGPFSIKPSISCAAGQLGGSRVDLALSDLKFRGAEIGETVLKLPLGGTVQKPALDFAGALQSLLSAQSVKIGKAVIRQELEKELAAQPAGAATNQTLGEAAGEALAEQLGKSVKELEGNEAVKESLKKLGTRFFGE